MINYTQYHFLTLDSLPKPMRRHIKQFLIDRGYNMQAFDFLTLYRYDYKHSMAEDYRIDGLLKHLDKPLFTIRVFKSSGLCILASNYAPIKEIKFYI